MDNQLILNIKIDHGKNQRAKKVLKIKNSPSNKLNAKGEEANDE
jgi:hypothetical protein